MMYPKNKGNDKKLKKKRKMNGKKIDLRKRSEKNVEKWRKNGEKNIKNHRRKHVLEFWQILAATRSLSFFKRFVFTPRV